MFVPTSVTSKPKLSMLAVLIFVPPEVAYLLWFTELGTHSFASVGLVLLPSRAEVGEAACRIGDHVTVLTVTSKADSMDLDLLCDRQHFLTLSTGRAHFFVPLLLLFLCLHLLYFIPSSVFHLQFLQWPWSSCLFSILQYILLSVRLLSVPPADQCDICNLPLYYLCGCVIVLAVFCMLFQAFAAV